jgi:hypothetical protein
MYSPYWLSQQLMNEQPCMVTAMPVIRRKVSVMTQTEEMHICGSTHTDHPQMAANTTHRTPSSTCTAQQYQHASFPQFSASLTGKQHPLQAKSEKEQNKTRFHHSNVQHCTHQHLCTRYSDAQHSTQTHNTSTHNLLNTTEIKTETREQNLTQSIPLLYDDKL